MAKNTQLSDVAANAQADAHARLLDDGYFRIYSGVQPEDADSPIIGQVLLATNRFAAVSAAAAEAGEVLFTGFIGENAVATGDATWYRCVKSDGSTVVMDGSIGAGGNLTLSSTSIQTGAPVQITSLSYSVAKATAGL
jgi:hypothetical protein